MSDHPAVERVWSAVTPAARRVLERELPPADLRTLLLDLARTRSAEVTAPALLRRWQEDRFVRPATIDARELHRVEGRLWDLLPHGFDAIELSPVAPLGSSASVTTVDQNQVVATVRGSEVISDATNVLAIEAATRRQAGRRDVIELAASHRVLRAQRFGPGLGQHFRLLHLVSSARDQGSGRTEAELLITHIGYWQMVLADLVQVGAPRITLSPFDDVTAQRIADTVLPSVQAGAVPVQLDTDRVTGRGYYRSAALGLRVDLEDTELDIGDGGFTDWTAQLTSNAKERCLISCVSVDRLAELGQLRPR